MEMEARDLNHVLETAYVRGCTLSMTVQSFGCDSVVFCMALGTPPWPE